MVALCTVIMRKFYHVSQLDFQSGWLHRGPMARWLGGYEDRRCKTMLQFSAQHAMNLIHSVAELDDAFGGIQMLGIGQAQSGNKCGMWVDGTLIVKKKPSLRCAPIVQCAGCIRRQACLLRFDLVLAGCFKAMAASKKMLRSAMASLAAPQMPAMPFRAFFVKIHYTYYKKNTPPPQNRTKTLPIMYNGFRVNLDRVILIGNPGVLYFCKPT